ncbi:MULTISPECIES: lysophospholipid acyltransferase family protein [Rhodococcus]|uniref:1-acyl-sn-glycerol-3-phosphate acyltransferase n=1 Tax=Rhodococcus oxybenzonivorans TaxID=1990687 RepID=A0AAE4V3L7_9NOCA|nr:MULTISPECIES: 1-acyl-sn-glycerol-3-phosphate acyltransferase [Rhodococcus]MDV7240440.1 1-acyl-sn-glycerol-3-phosphate acyltransferase [Rhodococcus oxybenzonivorans]MDV7268185.1 1-acyl-sn-glycerol-3-phosphate acyltransferase [Rhodococcus oxybenzonivorans]MDV7272714.1 1-acyl-sn-glycerol-3-phosphate acyltransferase [Rhodococcus oxybenzonivorans]MDV7333548.1 1-acyl-sn-glycerol-3-phosphate acyltransferase [Rhodococcus oxybenzonivorans]MDV7342715.1 1-acyl-sn-glycerol-3-phosphate acyltransferase [
MDRPEVTLENYRAVYDYYRDHQQNRVLAKLAYAMLSMKYRPRVRYADGAEEQLTELVKSGAVLLVAANHVTHSDQYTLAATAWKTPLRRVIGRTRVLAKDELFTDPDLRKKVDMMGGIPVFRSKNYGLRAVADAGRLMMDVAAERLCRGDNLAIFPEGTCNESDPTRLQHINSGIGHIAKRAVDRGVAPTLLSIGISYGPDAHGADTELVKGASVYVAQPLTALPAKPMDIAHTAQCELQKAVDGAVAAY